MPVIKKPNGEIVTDDLYPYLRRYKDGRVERLVPNTFVPPSEEPGTDGVATRDVVIDHATGVSARLFLNVAAAATERRLPLAVCFHGGAFCTGSAFSKVFYRQAATLSARAGTLVVSVDYRLAPEHPIPAAYDDGWAALRWVASLSEPWLAGYADPKRTFLFGDSAGGNIVHNLLAVLLQPFFWGPERLPSETDRLDGRHGPMFAPELVDIVWPFVTAGAAGNDDPRINPPAEEVASLRCRRALVTVASRDVMGDRGRRYAAWLRRGVWCREVTLLESEGEDHGFHLSRKARASAMVLMDRIVKFIHGGSEPLQQGTNKMGRDAFVVAPAKPPAGAGFRVELSRAGSSNLARNCPSAPATVGRTVAKSCL